MLHEMVNRVVATPPITVAEQLAAQDFVIDILQFATLWFLMIFCK